MAGSTAAYWPASPVGPEHGHDLARLGHQVEPVKGDRLAEPLAQPGRLDRRRHLLSPR